MKQEKGITLVSLIMYVAVMIIVLAVMSSVITNFYKNNQSLDARVEEILEFNKFNTYFLKEIKLYNNNIDSIKSEDGKTYILFSSGNSFLFDMNKIYYNNLEICDDVKNLDLEYGASYNDKNEKIQDKSIIKVTLNFETFSKTINYKVENIY